MDVPFKVDVQIGAMEVTVRDSKQDSLTYDQPSLRFSFAEWRQFIEAVKDGLYDVPNTVEIGQAVDSQ
jgi:hypothetical protein